MPTKKPRKTFRQKLDAKKSTRASKILPAKSSPNKGSSKMKKSSRNKSYS